MHTTHVCFMYITDCTKSLPKLTDEEITSGLATKILVELVQRDDSQQKHFTTLLFTLVPSSKKGGINASSLQVTHLLEQKSVTSIKLIERLFKFGMKVNEIDVCSAVKILQEHRVDVLQLLVKECAKTRKTTFTSACQEAIKAKKLKFVVCLIESGGKPDVGDLKEVTGWPQAAKVDPVIDAYLSKHVKKKGAEKPEYVCPNENLPNPEAVLVGIFILQV